MISHNNKQTERVLWNAVHCNLNAPFFVLLEMSDFIISKLMDVIPYVIPQIIQNACPSIT